jgi:hypothetical protein
VQKRGVILEVTTAVNIKITVSWSETCCPMIGANISDFHLP